MKLFYDMLIPYMPDKDVNDAGELVSSKQREAARNSMIELSEFQNDGNLIHLYNAVFQACIFAGVDIIDTILNLSADIEIPEVSIYEAVDLCAKALFRSVNPENPFDINQFAGILLTAAHFGIVSIKTATNTAEPQPEVDHQISIEEALNNEKV